LLRTQNFWNRLGDDRQAQREVGREGGWITGSVDKSRIESSSKNCGTADHITKDCRLPIVGTIASALLSKTAYVV
jgi:general stress protein YciG